MWFVSFPLLINDSSQLQLVRFSIRVKGIDSCPKWPWNEMNGASSEQNVRGSERLCWQQRGEKAMAKCVAFQFTAQTCRSLHLFQHCVFNLHMKITERAEGKDWCKHRLTYMFLLGVRPSKAQTGAGKPFTAAAHRNYAEREHTRTCKTAAVADFNRGNVWHASLISRKHV